MPQWFRALIYGHSLITTAHSGLFGVTNAPFRVFVIASSLRRTCLLMANKVPVVTDVLQLQDVQAVPPAQAGAAQDFYNVDGGEQPAAVAQVAVAAAQPVHEPNADVISSSCLLLACFAFFSLSVAGVLCGASQL